MTSRPIPHRRVRPAHRIIKRCVGRTLRRYIHATGHLKVIDTFRFQALMAGAIFLSWSVCLNATSAASYQSPPRVESLFVNSYTLQDYSLPLSDSSSLLPAGIATDAEGTPFIANIETFLNTCPSSDSATMQIRNDFQIRRNGILVEDIFCNEPISELPVAQYTDELIVLQGLRVIYYMDRGRHGHLPWTPGSLYDWMKTKIRGIDILDGSGSFCCESIDGNLFIGVGAQNDFNRDFDRKWEGISGNINLYAHETRHVDGFSHTSCCGIAGGCDQTYDLNNLSAYAVQWWLEKSWLMGDINVGISCLSPSRVQEITNWHLTGANSFRDRFCDEKPPMLLPPQIPGGQCPATDTDGDGVADIFDNCTLVPNPDQRDTDGDSYGNMCDGDLNNDGATNTIDLNIYKAAHRSKLGDLNYNPDADSNGDGAINTLDLNIYKGLHRKPPGPSCCAP